MNYRFADLAEFPALPEGWRWERAYSTIGNPIIQLRRKRRWGWKTVDYFNVFRTTYEPEKARNLLADRDFAKQWANVLGPVE